MVLHTPNQYGYNLMRLFLAIARRTGYVGNARSALFWNWKSRRKVFEHQSGFKLDQSRLDNLTEHSRMAVQECERLTNFELINRPYHSRSRINRSHHYLFNQIFADPVGSLDDNPPETLPHSSPSNPENILQIEATSPDSSIAPVLPISVSEHFRDIMTTIDTTQDAFVLTPTNDGGVIDLLDLLDTEIYKLRMKMNACQSQVQNIKDANETRIDELLDKIPTIGCTLSRTLIRDAVQAADGRTYDRSSIEQWFAKCRSNQTPLTSPWTRAVISEILVPNKFVQDMIDETMKHWGIH
jgi:hypothetical protein